MISSWVTDSAPWRIASDAVRSRIATADHDKCIAEARIGSFVWIGSLPMRRSAAAKNPWRNARRRVRGREF